MCYFFPDVFPTTAEIRFKKENILRNLKCRPWRSSETFPLLLVGSLQVKCVNSPLHFFQVKNAISNLKQFSTSWKMLEMFALELEPLRFCCWHDFIILSPPLLHLCTAEEN